MILPREDVSNQRPYRASSSPTVLVAEEDEDLRNTLVDELRKEGYRVVGLEDGLELRDYLDAAYAPEERVRRPAVVISDATLAGVGGAAVCEDMHTHDTWPGFILLADFDQDEVYVDAERAGADFVIDKPIDMEALRSAVSWLTSRPAPTPLEAHPAPSRWR